MKTRGRPRSPDILTPRQQEVLLLLRQGLTNEEIAGRLGISLDGAKWHVSEILMRLGVDSRHDAALWSPAAMQRSRFALLLAPIAALHKLKLSALGYAAAGGATIAVAAAIALLAWGVFRSSATQDHATDGASNQIVFTTEARQISSLDRKAPVWNVSTYDADQKRIVHSFEVGGEGDFPTQAVLAGDSIVVNLETRIVQYDLDGSNARELRRAREGGRILGVGASPDGALLAITEQTRPQFDEAARATPGATAVPYSEITLITVINRELDAGVLSIFASDPRLAGYHGQPVRVVWRDDGRGFIVEGYTYSHTVGGLATILLDGTVAVQRGAADYLTAPNARFVLDDNASVCGPFSELPARHMLAIRELNTDRIVTSVRDDALTFDPVEWSPDGTQLLYRTYPFATKPEDCQCPALEAPAVTWRVLPLDGAPPFDVADASDARRRWSGDEAIEYRCHGAVVVRPFCLDGGSDVDVDAYVGGALVVSGLDLRLIPNPLRHAADTQPAPNDATIEAQRRTGIPAVDRAIDLLVRTDVDGLVKLAEYASIGCSVAQTVGSPPPCALGQADGTIINAFPVGHCEGSYITSDDQLRATFELALQRQPSAAVYAVLRDQNTQDRMHDNLWVAVTQDRPSQATADVSMWSISADGKINYLQTECGPIGAAQEVAYRFPVNPDFVLGPYINCSPPPGDTANFMITVDSLSPGGIKPQFWGEAQTTLGEDTGERAIVTVTSATNWTGDINRLEDVRPGMLLQAVGKRQPDCTIVAETILTPVPSVYHDAALGLEMPYPFNWSEGAPAMPYATCNACAVLGPKNVRYAYGIQMFTQPLSPGCAPSCSFGIRALAQTAPQTLFVAGHQASQQELEREPPLDGSGETTFYRDIVTVIPLTDQALVVSGFFRYGDVDGERYVRRAYANALDSMKLPPP